jgi:glycosyltransferase involved in cell wall biosynthesis
MDKKYLHVITHYAPDFHYGGVVESGYQLFQCLKKLGNFRISTVSGNPEKVERNIQGEGKCYKSIYFHRYAFSLNAIWGLWRDIKNADVVYGNGIVTFPMTLAQLYAVLLNKPFAVATHGLTQWSFENKKWRKLIYFNLIAFPLMKRAKFIRVTSDAENQFLKSKGFTNTLMLSNGITVDDFAKLPDKYSFANQDKDSFVFLFLGRMGKEKGLDILVAAYKEFCKTFGKEKHRLLLVGPDLQGYLKNMAIDYEKENIEYIPGVYGDDKLKIIRRADVVILPSYSENFGNTVAEGLACERPVITTTGTPWKEIEAVGCGLYIQAEAAELYQAMKTMYLKSPDEREEMGCKGRKYILENFNWEVKAKELFKHLL